MQLYMITLLAACVRSQKVIDSSLLERIFNTPSSSDSNTITIRLKEGINSYVDDEGRKYTCTPQYPYDPNIKAEEMNNASITGCGIIDERVGDDEDDPCIQIVESICTMQLDPITPEIPKPPIPIEHLPENPITPEPQTPITPVPVPQTPITPVPVPLTRITPVPVPLTRITPVPVPQTPITPEPVPQSPIPPVTVPQAPITPEPLSPKCNRCGYRNINGFGEKSNNTETQFGEFPWVVALLTSSKQRYIGVGALISPEVVLTTAHVVCRRNKKQKKKQAYSSIMYPDWLKIRAGEWDAGTSEEICGYQERNVKEISILNEFNRTNPRHNIALLLLERPLDLTGHINVICLPEQDEVFDTHKNCIANGWNKHAFDLKSPNTTVLKKAEIDIVPYTRCSTLLKRTSLGSAFRLHSSFICAGGIESKNTCQGDGGAPLACPIGNSRYKLTGLVSWGIGCGQKDIPALYTNVPKYRQWVDTKMEAWGLQTSWYSSTDDDDDDGGDNDYDYKK